MLACFWGVYWVVVWSFSPDSLSSRETSPLPGVQVYCQDDLWRRYFPTRLLNLPSLRRRRIGAAAAAAATVAAASRDAWRVTAPVVVLFLFFLIPGG